MAEELRLFLRTGLYVAVAAAVYWLVSGEPAGTVLLGMLGLAVTALVIVVVAFAPRSAGELRTPQRPGVVRGALGALNRTIGFHERTDAAPPLEGGPDLIPRSSPWPIVTAGALVLMGLGAIFGSWLLVPGVVLLVMGGIGWLTQLDGV